jgi:hypothetical protein
MGKMARKFYRQHSSPKFWVKRVFVENVLNFLAHYPAFRTSLSVPLPPPCCPVRHFLIDANDRYRQREEGMHGGEEGLGRRRLRGRVHLRNHPVSMSVSKRENAHLKNRLAGYLLLVVDGYL